MFSSHQEGMKKLHIRTRETKGYQDILMIRVDLNNYKECFWPYSSFSIASLFSLSYKS